MSEIAASWWSSGTKESLLVAHEILTLSYYFPNSAKESQSGTRQETPLITTGSMLSVVYGSCYGIICFMSWKQQNWDRGRIWKFIPDNTVYYRNEQLIPGISRMSKKLKTWAAFFWCTFSHQDFSCFFATLCARFYTAIFLLVYVSSQRHGLTIFGLGGRRDEWLVLSESMKHCSITQRILRGHKMNECNIVVHYCLRPRRKQRRSANTKAFNFPFLVILRF